MPQERFLYFEGISFNNVDMTYAPKDVHAIQWHDDSGWIEFVPNMYGAIPPNILIDQLPDWAHIVLERCLKVS